MGHCLASAIAECEHLDEYQELATKPDPLTEDEAYALKHHKARLLAGLQAEHWTSPHTDKEDRWRDKWRRWFAEEPPPGIGDEAISKALGEVSNCYTRPKNREALAAITPEVAKEFFANVRKKNHEVYEQALADIQAKGLAPKEQP